MTGPTVLGRAKCPCGQGSEVHSHCENKPFGPKEFIIWFKFGRFNFVRVQNFWFIGSFDIQEMVNLNPGSDSLLLQRSKNIYFYPKGQSGYVQSLGSDPLVIPCLKASRALSLRGFFRFSELPHGTSREALNLHEVGFGDLPIPTGRARVSNVSVSIDTAPHPTSSSPVPPDSPVTCRPGSPCPSGRVTVQEDLSKVYSAFFRNAGCSHDTLRVLLSNYAPGTFKQSQGVWFRFGSICLGGVFQLEIPRKSQ